MTEEVKNYFLQDPIGKILLACVIAFVFWLGNTVQNLTVDTAVQNARITTAIQGMESQLVQLSQDRYTGTQAKADQALLKQDLENFRVWLQNLSERVREVEKRQSNG